MDAFRGGSLPMDQLGAETEAVRQRLVHGSEALAAVVSEFTEQDWEEVAKGALPTRRACAGALQRV